MKATIRRTIALITACLFLSAAVAACSGIQTVQPYEIGKVAAESLLYDARVLQNQGVITPDQFAQIRKIYDQLSIAQSIAIDARKMVIVYNTAENQDKVRLTMSNVTALSSQLLDLAISLGIKGVSK